jgi:hypothetical protein
MAHTEAMLVKDRAQRQDVEPQALGGLLVGDGLHVEGAHPPLPASLQVGRSTPSRHSQVL